MQSRTFEVTLDSFDASVINASHDVPILVDFWAGWCQPCLVIAPILQQVVEEYDSELRLAKIEVDEGENMKLAGQYRVRGFPTVVLFHHGEEKGRFSGARSAGDIEQFIDDLI